MKFVNIWTELLCKPWVIVPEMHAQLCEIVRAHMLGRQEQIEAAIINLDGEKVDTMRMVGDVAVIPLQGVVGHRVSDMQKSSGVLDVNDFGRDITKAAADKKVAGIFLDVASPGGAITGVPETAAIVAQTARTKPVVAFTDSLMASAAYWLGSGATEIVASQSAVVGSIGVYMAWLDRSRAMDLAGLKTELIKHGKFKATGIEGIPLTDEQRAMLQAEVDKVYSWFSGAVRKSRGVVADETMEGQSFLAEDAVKMNLADAVGSAEDAMAELRDLIKENGT